MNDLFYEDDFKLCIKMNDNLDSSQKRFGSANPSSGLWGVILVMFS